MVLKRVFKLLVNSSILVWGFLSLLVTSFEQKFSDAASDNDCLIGQSCEVGVVNAEKAKCGLFHRDCASMDRVEEQPAYASRKTSAEMQREVAWGEASVWDGDTMTTNSQISRHLDKSHRFLRSVWQRAPCVLPRWAPHIKNGVTRSCKSPIGCNMQPWHPLYLGASSGFHSGAGSAHHRRADGTDLATKLPSSQSNQAFLGCHGSNTVPPQSPLQHWTG